MMADYPQWFLGLVGRFRYGRQYEKKLKAAAAASQQRQYPQDFVASFIQGDGKNFDYGLDITECGICKLYSVHGAAKLARYMCLSDYVISTILVLREMEGNRYETIAEGGGKCDFRYKKGRETFVYPLRKGWPPDFHNNNSAA